MEDHCPHFRDYDEIIINESGDLREEIFVDESQDALRGRRAPPVLSAFPGNNSRTKVHPPSDVKVQVKKDLDVHQLLLLLPETRAFGLKTKQWCT